MAGVGTDDRQTAGSELVAAPANGRVYSGSVRAGLADCAPSGRARLDALARWLQDIAYADVEDAGLHHTAIWVLRRTRLKVERFPRFAERFAIHTFCSGLGRMWAERRTTIARAGEAATDVEAVSLWVHLDPATRRPAPFAPEEIQAYGGAAPGRKVTARLRHPRPPATKGARSSSWVFRATDCDVAGHVNNAAYWQPLEEELLAGAEPDGIDAEIEFRTPAQPGEKIVLRDGARWWILDRDGEAHASMVVAHGLPETGPA